jgi:hypothetical protein
MRVVMSLFAISAVLLSTPAAGAQDSGRGRLLDILPAGGLDKTSIFIFHDQAALDTRYYLADEKVLGLNEKAEAVFARYLAGPGEALLLIVSYPSEEEARRAHERFGGDFFSKRFDAKNARTVERLESGEYAAAVRARTFLIVVLEAPDRKTCDELARRAEERALGRF